jgi:lipopolysaccharide transport system ATP-binding protein
MQENSLAISSRGLTKRYTIRHEVETHTTLTEWFLARLKSPLKRGSSEIFTALDNVDFDIHQGDVVGVVGRNGAGKSTLLKVLSRIVEPTSGEVKLYGRVGSLLEVGTGFHPELTGRENIFLNGTILGMRRQEIQRQFDAIVDFAGIEQFLDTPVKRYSSGMYVRLAFAVAAHLESEILLVDEVLSVGDAEFQRKCLGKMRDVASGGRTVLFVSHHMQSVQVLCNRAIYLERGRITHCGSVAGAIDCYINSFSRPTASALEPDRRPGSGEFRFTHVAPAKLTFTCGEEKIINFTLERRRAAGGQLFVSALVVDEYGTVVAQCDSRLVNFWLNGTDRYDGRLSFSSPWLKPGVYRVELFACSAGVVDRFEEACQLEILPLLPYDAAGNDEATRYGIVFADFKYQLN